MKNIFLIKRKLYCNSPHLFSTYKNENIKFQLNNTINIFPNITYEVIQLFINNLRITLFNSFNCIH